MNAPSSSTPSPFAFVDGALDRADALRDDAAALSAMWDDARVVLLDDDGRALTDDNHALLAPTGAELGGMPAGAVFLGKRDDVAWFAARSIAAAPEGSPSLSAATARCSGTCRTRGSWG